MAEDQEFISINQSYAMFLTDKDKKEFPIIIIFCTEKFPKFPGRTWVVISCIYSLFDFIIFQKCMPHQIGTIEAC